MILRDFYLDKRPGAWQWGGGFTFGTHQGAATNFMQSGSVNTDANVNNAIGSWLLNLYPAVVREYMATRARVYPTQVLTNPNYPATQNPSVVDYLTNWGAAFVQLRAIESLLDVGDFNQPGMLMSAAVSQSVLHLQAQLMRLKTYPVPQMFVDWLDHLCGAMAIDDDSPLFIAIPYSAHPQFDLTSAANITTILNSIDATQLTNLASGVFANQAADFAAISQVFALMYGLPQWGEKKLMIGPECVAPWIQEAATYDDTTANKLFTFPNVNDSTLGHNIPILMPKGSSGDFYSKALLTLLRPAAYSVDSTAGIANTNLANQVGIFVSQSLSTAGSEFGYYNQAGTFTAIDLHAAGATVPNYLNGQTELAVWGSEAANEAASIEPDQRLFRDYDLVYVPDFFLIEETVYTLSEMFLLS